MNDKRHRNICIGDALYAIADATQTAGIDNPTSELLRSTLRKNISQENIKYTLLNEVINIENSPDNGCTKIATKKDSLDYLDDLHAQINEFCRMEFAADMQPLIRMIDECITIYWLTYDNELFNTLEEILKEKILHKSPRLN